MPPIKELTVDPISVLIERRVKGLDDGSHDPVRDLRSETIAKEKGSPSFIGKQLRPEKSKYFPINEFNTTDLAEEIPVVMKEFFPT